MSRVRLLVCLVSSIACAGGCAIGEDTVSTNRDRPTWEEFRADTYLEPWEGGVFIVNGDTPIENEKKLREFYDLLYGGGELIVQRSGGADARWSDSMKRSLTYCISDSFGSNKQAVIEAMSAATDDGWETFADVDFTYVPSEDGSCNAQNGDVVFDVRPTSGAPYLARAFFPGQARSSRNVVIDTSAFGGFVPLGGLLGHELGHALGFRHEHTRPEAGACYEDSSWRELTPYDSDSIMMYPQCGGTGQELTFSSLDAEGAAALYGPAEGGGGNDGGGNDDGDGDGDDDGDDDGGGQAQSGSHSTSVDENEQVFYEPLDVVPGSPFHASISGSGDADLYVRFDDDPSLQAYDCRPYRIGSSESCDLDVPAGASTVHIMVHGYASASYTLEATWVQP